MGLGAPKRRNKLAHDPNNTAWSKSTDTFGHKILARQGWTPGTYLGAENASHSDHYTAANASHIRVLLREENLGLGATVGKTNAETFGLSLLSGVFGRLNGKTEEEISKHQDALRDAELRTFHAQKYGMVGFVRGGWLVGDKMQEKKDEQGVSAAKDLEHQTKKRKVEDDAHSDEISTTPAKKQKTKGKMAEKSSASSSSSDEERSTSTRKHKKRKDMHNKPESATSTAPTSEDDRSARKQERRARKEARRKRREEKVLRRKEKALRRKRKEASKDLPPSSADAPRPPAPLVANRQTVRHRYIQQKRMASMDPQAMKEIFMLKAAA